MPPPGRRSVDLGHSAYDRGFPRSGEQRSELMSIAIPKWVRVLEGVTYPLGGSRERRLSARNGISQIAEIWNNNNWLPDMDSNHDSRLQRPLSYH